MCACLSKSTTTDMQHHVKFVRRRKKLQIRGGFCSQNMLPPTFTAAASNVSCSTLLFTGAMCLSGQILRVSRSLLLSGTFPQSELTLSWLLLWQSELSQSYSLSPEHAFAMSKQRIFCGIGAAVFCQAGILIRLSYNRQNLPTWGTRRLQCLCFAPKSISVALKRGASQTRCVPSARWQYLLNVEAMLCIRARENTCEIKLNRSSRVSIARFGKHNVRAKT